MTSPSASREQLHTLIDAALCGSITTEQAGELDAILRTDREACEIYSEHASVDAELHLLIRGRNASEKISRKIYEPSESASEMVAVRSVATPPPILPPFNSPFSIHPSPLSAYLSSGWPAAYVVATLIVGIGLAVGALVHVSGPGSGKIVRQFVPGDSPVFSSSITNGAFVGRITGMVDCVWEGTGDRVRGAGAANQKSEVKNHKSDIHLGDLLAIKSGLLEITYDTGAKVILQGPVRYEVESAAGGYLSIGRLTAKLEKKLEVGRQRSEPANQKSEIRNQKSFAVRTPTAIVTDLGTEFGVEVDQRGSTTSHVFRGLIRLQAVHANGTVRGADLVLGKNESAGVWAVADRRHASEAAVRCDVAPGRFVRGMPRSATPLPIHVLAHFRLGDDDSNALAGRPAHEQTMNRHGAWHLKKHGLPRYVGETPASNSRLAMNFTGTDGDYFYSDAFRWTPTGNFVLEAWVRVRRIGKEPMYVVYNGDSGADGYGLMVWDGKWLFLLGGRAYGDSGATCEPGRWTHVALVCEDGKSQLWANGQPVGVTDTSAINVPSRCFAIGGYREEGKTASHSLDGEVDEVRLFEFQAPFKPEMLLFQSPTSEPSQKDKRTDGRSQTAERQ